MLWGGGVRNAGNLGNHPQEWQVLFMATIRISFNPTMTALSQPLSATTTSKKCTLHLLKQCLKHQSCPVHLMSYMFILTNKLNKYWKSHMFILTISTPPAKKTEPSNLVLRAQDHKKNPKFKGWQWDLKNPKFKIRSSKERRTKSEITEIVVEKYVFKIPKIQNFRNTRNQ